MVDVAQSVRASDCGSEGRRFETDLPPRWNGELNFDSPFFYFFPVGKNGNSDEDQVASCNITRWNPVVFSMKTGNTFASSSVHLRYSLAHGRQCGESVPRTCRGRILTWMLFQRDFTRFSLEQGNACPPCSYPWASSVFSWESLVFLLIVHWDHEAFILHSSCIHPW